MHKFTTQFVQKTTLCCHVTQHQSTHLQILDRDFSSFACVQSVLFHQLQPHVASQCRSPRPSQHIPVQTNPTRLHHIASKMNHIQVHGVHHFSREKSRQKDEARKPFHWLTSRKALGYEKLLHQSCIRINEQLAKSGVNGTWSSVNHLAIERECLDKVIICRCTLPLFTATCTSLLNIWERYGIFAATTFFRRSCSSSHSSCRCFASQLLGNFLRWSSSTTSWWFSLRASFYTTHRIIPHDDTMNCCNQMYRHSSSINMSFSLLLLHIWYKITTKTSTDNS